MCQKNYQKIKAVGTVTKLSEYKITAQNLKQGLLTQQIQKQGTKEGQT